MEESTKQQLKGLFWGGGLILVIAIFWVLLKYNQLFFYQVESYQKAVIFTLGEAKDEALSEGLHLKWPWPIERVEIVDTEIDRKIQIGFKLSDKENSTKVHLDEEASILTSGANIVDIEAEINYHISDLRQFVIEMDEPEEAIRDASEAVLNRIIGLNSIQDILTEKKAEIASVIKSELQKVLDSYEIGIQVDRVQFIKVLNPIQVREAFESVESAKQDSAISVERAKGYRNQELPKARGDAQALIQDAEAFAISRVNQAQGETAEFKAYLRRGKANRVTRQRLYLETMEEVLPKVKKVIMDDKSNTIPLLNLQGGLKWKSFFYY